MNSKTILASAALAFAITRAVANPQTVPFVGDDETRIRADRVYTHALDFGGHENHPQVNGVQFFSTPNATGSHGGYSWEGFPSAPFPFQNDCTTISSPPSSGIYQVLADFNYSLKLGSVWLRGLTPGKVYETRFYHRPFGVNAARWQTFTFKPDATTADSLRFNPDEKMGDQMLIYRYTAGGNALEIVFNSMENEGDTYHCYGVVNEQVYEVTPGEVTQLTADSARLNGQAITGGEASTVTAYWQPSNAADWATAESAELAVTDDGVLHFDISGLVPASEYRFRMSLTNALRSSWSKTGTFSTLPDKPVFSVNPAQVTGTTATLGGTLLYCGPGQETVDVTLYWGADPEVSSMTSVVLSNVAPGAFSTTLEGLDYGGTYCYLFKATNANDAEMWQDAPGWFTTLGAPVWGASGAATIAQGTLELTASLLKPGAAVASVTCWLGATPESMQAVTNWPASGAVNFAHTLSGLATDAVYYYAFHALCEADAQNSWSVWSATNQVRVAQIHPLLPALTTGYYNVLLHLGANLGNDVINDSNIDTDHLAAFGGETAQTPYPGLTLSGLPVPGTQRDLTWTILTNNNANGLWTMNRDNYVKYWHIYIHVPGDTNRNARIHYTCDDNIRVWRNGERILDAAYTPNEASVNITLLPGVNSIGIKFRELSGDDKMGFRITDRNNTPFDDLRYSFTASVLSAPVVPLTLSLTHDAITFDPNFTYTHSLEDFNLYAVCDTQDRGAVFSAWTNSPSCLLQTFTSITTPPASIEFAHLGLATPYVIRFFTVKQGFWQNSLPLAFSTYGVTANIASLPPSDATGVSVVANASLGYCGPGLSTADVYLYWWDDATATTNSAVKLAQSAGPVAMPVTGLWYSQDYHYRFAASNEFGFAWSPEPVQFTTPGVPIFGAITHSTPEPNILRMNAEILYPGPVEGAVTYWFGTDPDLLASVGGDTLDAPGAVSFTQSNLQVGGVYYYAFQIESSVTDGGQFASWNVWSSTNRVVLSGVTEWTAGGGSNTDWNNPANWSHGVPGPGGTAKFPAGDVFVTASRDIAIATINILSGADTVTFDFGGFTLDAATFNVGLDNVAGNFLLASGVMNFTDSFFVGRNAGTCNASLASGSRVITQHLYVGYDQSGNRLTVESGAALTARNTANVGHRSVDKSIYNNELLVRGLFCASEIWVGVTGGWSDSAALMTVDGGVVTNTALTAIGRWTGNGHTLTLQNNARYIQTTGALSIGGRATSNPRVSILSGSEFDLNGRIYLAVNSGNVFPGGGTDWGGERGWLVVSNATLRATGGLEIGRGNSGTDNTVLLYEDPGHTTIVAPGNNLDVGGASSRNLFGFHGGHFDLSGLTFNTTATAVDSRIHFSRPSHLTAANFNARADIDLITFDLPVGAVYTYPVLDITGNASFSPDTRVEINLGKFQGSATLFSSATGDLTPDAVTVNQAQGYNHKLIAEPNLLQIRAWLAGSLFIVR